ncbi:MAG: ABC transporter ATP-binding protein [Candidatus Eremiobacteraeota bacterium]|nr:ABC transporter ATP-binding protein [Candidatus Eremiobacteraeota bacterium]
MNGHFGRGGAISLRNVNKVYTTGGTGVVAVDDWNLEVAAGEFVVVVGPSGCGKTTLLNGLAGFDTITGGEIRLDDTLIASPTKMPKPGSDRVVVFQNGALFPWKTVLENVTYGPLVQRKTTREEVIGRARDLLLRVGLSDVADAYPQKLSSGVQRRVELIRALINDPKVLLLDEPFRALDAMSKSVMHEYMLQLYDYARKTVFFITHDLDEAIFLADRVVVCTSRPARVKQSLVIDLPRPRTYKIMATPEFLALKERVAGAVHEEAQKAFALGERELA